MVSVTKSEQNGSPCIGTEALCRGRTPFASAYIYGETANGDINGYAELYYTPLGMLVKVGVSGLEDGVYSLSLGREGQIILFLPPLYAKNGSAWCTALTGKISASEILGTDINIIGYHEKERTDIAYGVIQSPLLKRFELMEAE